MCCDSRRRCSRVFRFQTEEMRKPASQRVHDAAEQLLFSLFSIAVSEYKQIFALSLIRPPPFQSSPVTTDVQDEAFLRTKFGKFADSSKFRHFFLNQNALMSIVELTECADAAKGWHCIASYCLSPPSPSSPPESLPKLQTPIFF